MQAAAQLVATLESSICLQEELERWLSKTVSYLESKSMEAIGGHAYGVIIHEGLLERLRVDRKLRDPQDAQASECVASCILPM